MFMFPQQEIITFGFPTDGSRAMLTLDEVNSQLTTVVDGTCPNCDGVKLRYIQVNGSRNNAGRIAGGANIEMGGPNSDQVVEHVHSFNPRSWSCLHIFEGSLNCARAIIQNNDIGPCGEDQYGEWADGLSIACANSTVRDNLITSPTDGGIVLFGSPGTIVENNTISIGTNLVDYHPWSGDYRGTIVRQNTIIGGLSNGPPLIKGDEDGPNSGDAIIKFVDYESQSKGHPANLHFRIGIAVGTRIWFGESIADNDVLQGALITNNVFKGAFSFAIAASSVLDFTILNNLLEENCSFIGFRGLDCPVETAPGPQPFIAQMSSIIQSTLQADFISVTDIDLLVCFVPPKTGDYWPFDAFWVIFLRQYLIELPIEFDYKARFVCVNCGITNITTTMTTTTTQAYGVTPPISTQPPTIRELEITETMMAELRRQNAFESEEEARARELVLGRVAGLVKKFVYQVCIQRGLSEAAAQAAGGKIFTFGSYRLGVHGPGTDIDTLCVVPKHVAREDFFTVFEPMLREFEGVAEVSSQGVPEAYVPIIKTKISGIAIDFLFARLALATIPDDLELKDDNLLRNLDERCVRSLGGSRVTDEMLRLVPNVAVFRDSLRCIKLWAQRRAIHSNVNGFLGGVAWSMLVARICQLYPNGAAGSIISRNWPQPVLLKQIEEGPLNVRVWNPKLYPSDRMHRMPIITPAYPAMCSTHNVTKSTQFIMTQECKRAAEIVNRIVVGTGEWSELFAKHDFFYRYRYYLQVIASTGNPELQLKWAGTVESRIRQLVMKLELVESIEIVHPFVKGFEKTYHCMSAEEIRAVAQGEVTESIIKQTEEDIAGKEGSGTVYVTSFFVGLEIQPKKVGSIGPRKLDLSFPTSEFIKMIKLWDRYDDDKMGLVVRHIKNQSLPDYTLDQDRPRNTKRPNSEKVNAKNGVPTKKRRSSISEPQPPQPVTSQGFTKGPSETPIIEIPPPNVPSYAGLTKSPTGLRTPPSIPFGENTVAPT
ncbi:hypothetical protein Clacol_001411 [Clathrus columnatus]|uniref:polynucleotide adenylyltransferase n=1 Tax=Clathrus columnatus TaxID=1419009 RepID=A0AAV5A2G6_9AGAM|nr:hypothetical protein Clacol_001411 [Clathrus columnatus]